MTWEDEWPGTPYQGAGEKDEDEETDSFRVALKPSACRADPTLSKLSEDSGEVVTYESRSEAERALIETIECPGLRFQRPAPNDPGEVDAYLVKVREPEPAPDERGCPADGWTFQTNAHQVGVLAEALLGATRWNPKPVVAYVARDLGLSRDDFCVEVNPTPSSVGQHEFDEAGGRWVPDFEFIVRRTTHSSPHNGPVLKRYLAEVKHGSTSFGRNQRAQMTRLAATVGPDLDVLIIRIRLDDIPQSYDLTIRTIDAE